MQLVGSYGGERLATVLMSVTERAAFPVSGKRRQKRVRPGNDARLVVDDVRLSKRLQWKLLAGANLLLASPGGSLS